MPLGTPVGCSPLCRWQHSGLQPEGTPGNPEPGCVSPAWTEQQSHPWDSKSPEVAGPSPREGAGMLLPGRCGGLQHLHPLPAGIPRPPLGICLPLCQLPRINLVPAVVLIKGTLRAGAMSCTRIPPWPSPEGPWVMPGATVRTEGAGKRRRGAVLLTLWGKKDQLCPVLRALSHCPFSSNGAGSR